MRFKGICTDIDGTLLDSRRELSPRTIAAIKSLDNKVPVILASSRMPSAMRHLQQELGILHQPIICYNGGFVIFYDGVSSRPFILDTVQIPVSICSDIVSMAQETDIHVSLFSEDEWYPPRQDQWTEKEARVTKVAPTAIETLPVLERWQKSNAGAHKVMCMGPEEEIHQMEQELISKFSDQIFIYRSKSTYLELAPKTISKATALELLLKQRFEIGMADMVAFGDNYNDIDMLKAVGMGIAVGNARDEAKAVAKELTLNSTDDGVAIAIEKYFK